jgi:hypothetical protein
MEQFWNGVKAGWRSAGWGEYFLLALFPQVMLLVLLAFLVEGQVSTPPPILFWLACIPPVLLSLYWAGLRTSMDSWIGRLVLGVSIFLLFIVLIKTIEHTGAKELSITRRIGKYEVTVPVKLVAEDEVELRASVRRASPDWWQRVDRVLATAALALESIRRATWST